MTYAAAFNGGRSQTNFNFLQIGGEFMFLNILKEGQNWNLNDSAGSPTPSELDTNGYPTAAVYASHGGVYTILYVPSQAVRAGRYVVTWSGNGTIYFGSAHTGANGYTDAEKTSTGGSGRYEFTPTDPRIHFGMNATGTPCITDIKIFYYQDETALNAGQIFGTKLKERLAEANFGVFRFMNQQQDNISNVTNWASRKPDTYWSYGATEYRSNLYAGTAALTGKKYSVAAPTHTTSGTAWAGLVDKTTVHARFDTAYSSKAATFSNGSANIAVTAHGQAINDTVWFRSDFMPGNFVTYRFYYVVSVPDANTMTVSTEQGGAAVVAASTGSGVSFRPSLNATFTNGSANIAVTSHGMAVNDKLYLTGDPAAPIANFTFSTMLYYVVSVPNANTITISATQGGTAIVAGSSQVATIAPLLSLNVGSTGDINILSQYGTPLFGNAYPIVNRTATLVYDATLNAWVKFGGDEGQANHGITSGVPPIILFQLAAEMGAHPWFTATVHTCDPATDYMPTLMAYCRDNAPSWMIPRFEGPNELWNYAGGFQSTSYADAKAHAYGWGNYHDWYGKIMSVLGQQAGIVYGFTKAQVKTQKRYQMLLGVQSANAYLNQVSAADQRAESQAYRDQAAAAQSPYVKDRACEWVTHICVATYYNPADYSTDIETEYADAYASTGDQRIADVYARSSLGYNPARFVTAPELLLAYQRWKAWCLARSTPIMNMTAYEGCYSPDYIENQTNRNLLKEASKHNSETGGHLMSVYYYFTSQTDSTFTAEFPSNFIIGDVARSDSLIPNVSNYVWSVFHGDIYATPTPQWYAICAYNSVGNRAGNPRLRLHA